MKTREEIEQEYQNNVEILYTEFGDKLREVATVREAALAELDDPMLRLIAAARRTVGRHAALGSCGCEPCIELRAAVDYAEQRRAQG